MKEGESPTATGSKRLTRLDRLVNLLSSGQTESVRSTAACQIGAIAAQRARRGTDPQGRVDNWPEIAGLAAKVVPVLRNKSTDARSAAALAIDHICHSVGVWEPLEYSTEDDVNSEMQQPDAPLQSFILRNIITLNPQLLASSGAEYTGTTAQGETSHKDILQRLGLSGPANTASDLELDLQRELQDGNEPASSIPATPASSTSHSESIPDPEPQEQDLSHLSARERNALKRKRKKGQISLSAPSAKARKTETPPSPVKKVKKEDPSESILASETAQPVVPSGATKIEPSEAPEGDDAALPPHIWPFTRIVEMLVTTLTDSNWVVRHGSALGLTAILAHQGQHGGQERGQPAAANQSAHESWTQQIGYALLQLLATDRFGDYVGDTVLAPVREAASEALAALLATMSYDGRELVRSALCSMVTQQDCPPPKTGNKIIWQVRHSGLLGLRALVSHAMQHNHSFTAEQLREVVQVGLLGLQDGDDDVRSAAAAIFRPIAGLVVNLTPDLLPSLLACIWHCLSDLKDDLSSSVGNVMMLLSDLLALQPVLLHLAAQPPGQSLADVPPLLYPYFRHTISSVRSCVVNTIQLLLSYSSASSASPLASTPVLRLLFQNLIVEDKLDIAAASKKTYISLIHHLASQDSSVVWQLTKDIYHSWFSLISTSIGTPLSPSYFFRSSGTFSSSSKHDVDAAAMRQDLTLLDELDVLRGRLDAAQAFAYTLSTWPELHRTSALQATLLPSLSNPSYFTSFLSAVMLQDLVEHLQTSDQLVQADSVAFRDALLPLLDAPLPLFCELSTQFSAFRQECELIIKKQASGKGAAKDKRVAVNSAISQALSKQDLDKLASLLDRLRTSDLAIDPEVVERTTKALLALHRYRQSSDLIEARVSAARAGAVVALGTVPPKLNPIIKSLMNSIKFEASPGVQERAASSLATFVQLCGDPASSAKTNPSDKIVSNLCSFLCQETPNFATCNSTSQPFWVVSDDNDVPDSNDQADSENKRISLVRRGAEMALKALSMRYGANLLKAQPKLESRMSAMLIALYTNSSIEEADSNVAKDEQQGQDCLDALTVLPVVSKFASSNLQPKMLELLPLLLKALTSRYPVIRSVASECTSQICEAHPVKALHAVVTVALPLLSDMQRLESRRGVLELISNLVNRLETEILPFILFFLVPTLGRTTDSDPPVRSLATRTFARLVRLVPLEAGLPEPPGFPSELLAQKDEERKFLSQLLNGSKAELYEVPVPISAELRKYQREGVSWLAFLAKYKLHGILCDDMGLGKTLQTICILASVTHERQQKFEETQNPEFAHQPSLVVCPPTLASHWTAEIEQYASNLRVTQIDGSIPTSERARQIKNRKKTDVYVTSYEVLRNDIEVFSGVKWTYCILDEGHIIRNAKTKMAQAVKRIEAAHRLILSGTPVQNHVLELWSLFDFLMPGFLGSQRSFNERFSKPIKASRDAKMSSKEQAAGTLALEALHRQVLPFVLRRLKEDVLDDLPPKIIQDYYCNLSPLQQALYDRRSKTGDEKEDSSHVFQNLQYMRKLVNHPLLVLQQGSEDHKRILREEGNKTGIVDNLHNIGHAPKLESLRQILSDCGIGVKGEGDASETEAVAQHRVLIFCQMRQMLDIIEEDLFRPHMPDVTYMRLDGTVSSNKRHAVVQTFNSDPSIDVLLLTTSVGGLGLTLTGADTVIFVEHDWNPMKDLQAMDRAHRLGQKRVVNVYRLITRGTLEEKIMGLQQFKLNIASSVVNDENTAMGSMETDQVLDLFDGPVESSRGKKASTKGSGKSFSRKALIEGLGDLGELS